MRKYNPRIHIDWIYFHIWVGWLCWCPGIALGYSCFINAPNRLVSSDDHADPIAESGRNFPTKLMGNDTRMCTYVLNIDAG